ncbi:MAG: hypothetical protein M1831_006076 [Alyxoria varia]|nr:MAG: hypothetical protein M1831_006076 [Alyxoria varia]
MLSRLLSPRGLLAQSVDTSSDDSDYTTGPVHTQPQSTGPLYEIQNITAGHLTSNGNTNNPNGHPPINRTRTLIAVQDISAGTTILTEAPLLLLQHGRKPLMLWTAFTSLPPHTRSRYLDLPSSPLSITLPEMYEIADAAPRLARSGTHWPTDALSYLDKLNNGDSFPSSSPSDEKKIPGFPRREGEDPRTRDLAQQLLHITRIINTNALPYAGPMRFASAVFPTLTKVKHSCLPNMEASFDDSSKTGVLRSVRDIKAGEELTVDWVDGAFEVWEERTRRLEMIGRWCECEACAISDGGGDGSAGADGAPKSGGFSFASADDGHHDHGKNEQFRATPTSQPSTPQNIPNPISESPYHPYTNPSHTHTPSDSELHRLEMTLHHTNLQYRLHHARHKHRSNSNSNHPRIPETLAIRLLVSGSELSRLQDLEPSVRTSHSTAHEALALAYLALNMPDPAVRHLREVERILQVTLGAESQWVRDVRAYVWRVDERMMKLEEDGWDWKGAGGGLLAFGAIEDTSAEGHMEDALEEPMCLYETLIEGGLLWFFDRYGGNLFRLWEESKPGEPFKRPGNGEMTDEEVQWRLKTLKREGRLVDAVM